jgi:hypothetical protein
VALGSNLHHRAASQDKHSDRGPRWPGGARHLPQRGERVLRTAGEGAGSARFDHRSRPRGGDFRRRVRSGERGVAKRPHAWRPVQSLVSQGDAGNDRGHREVSRLRHDPATGEGRTDQERITDAVRQRVIAVGAASAAVSRYLADDRMSIQQIAWLLGYSEVGAFNHAYKRWTGTTPGRARKSSSTPP